MLREKKERLINYYQGQNLSERQINNRLKKEEQKEIDEKMQRKVVSMTINIDWKKSKMYGYCPKAYADIHYNNGYKRTEIFSASGCGYDKESTVIASILNENLNYKLWEIAENKEIDRKTLPYGLCINDEYNHYFSGGIGTSCYYDIIKFLGGKFESIANGKNFNVYKITF